MKRFILYTTILLGYMASSMAGTRSQGYSLPRYSSTKSVQLHHLNDELIMRMTGHFIMCDSVIIFPAINVDNQNVFQVLSAVDGRFITSFANVGRSAEELSDYMRLSLDPKRRMLYALDNTNKYIVIDINKVLSKNTSTVVSKGHYVGPFPVSRTIDYHDGKLLQMGGYPADRIFVTNTACDTILRYNVLPPVTPVIDQNDELHSRYFLYNSHYAVRPDGKKIANVTTNGMLLEILDVTERAIKQATIKYIYEPKLERSNMGKPECVFGASHICTTNEYIYVLYYDATIAELPRSKAKVGVFDWQGNALRCYELDDIVATFSVSHDNKRVYCWAYNSNGEEYLGCFDLR